MFSPCSIEKAFYDQHSAEEYGQIGFEGEQEVEESEANENFELETSFELYMHTSYFHTFLECMQNLDFLSPISIFLNSFSREIFYPPSF